jgi:hypothetical protein
MEQLLVLWETMQDERVEKVILSSSTHIAYDTCTLGFPLGPYRAQHANGSRPSMSAYACVEYSSSYPRPSDHSVTCSSARI